MRYVKIKGENGRVKECFFGFSDTTTTLLSVIVPFYNAEAYFRECLASLERECSHDPRLEVILVDDGSTDMSAAIAQESVQRLPEQMRLLRQTNQGPGRATNNGIYAARGKYIGFADSDDWIDRGMYTTMLDTAVGSEADIVICDFKKVFPDGTSRVFRYLDTGHKGIDPHTRPETLFSIGFSPWNKVVRRELFVQYDLFFPEGMNFQDVVVFVLMVSRVHRIVNTGQACYNYRVRKGSLIHSWNDSVYDIFRALDIIKQRIPIPFKEAMVYLALREILFYHLPRYCYRDNAEYDLYYARAVEYIKISFPDWKRNRYLQNASRWQRVYVHMLLQGKRFPVCLLASLKKLWHY